MQHAEIVDQVLRTANTSDHGTDRVSKPVQAIIRQKADTPENCQVGIFLCYATRRGQALVDRELYLPSSWTNDRHRCRAAAIPDEVGFATTAEQARVMLQRAADAEVPFAWVAAPEVHGQGPGLRGWLEAQELAYLMATRCDDTVPYGLDAGTRVDRLIDRIRPPAAWRPMPCGGDANELHDYEWVRMPMRDAFGRGRKGWVLARRSPTDPGDIAYYMCRCPRSTPLAELVRVTNTCSAAEKSVQTANEVDLDDYQVLRYDAWYAHLTLAMGRRRVRGRRPRRYSRTGTAPVKTQLGRGDDSPGVRADPVRVTRLTIATLIGSATE